MAPWFHIMLGITWILINLDIDYVDAHLHGCFEGSCQLVECQLPFTARAPSGKSRVRAPSVTLSGGALWRERGFELFRFVPGPEKISTIPPFGRCRRTPG